MKIEIETEFDHGISSVILRGMMPFFLFHAQISDLRISISRQIAKGMLKSHLSVSKKSLKKHDPLPRAQAREFNKTKVLGPHCVRWPNEIVVSKRLPVVSPPPLFFLLHVCGSLFLPRSQTLPFPGPSPQPVRYPLLLGILKWVYAPRSAVVLILSRLREFIHLWFFSVAVHP